MTDDGCDAGSATVWVVTAVGVVLAVAAWCVVASGVGAVRGRAATAADLAALAGAARLADGTGEPCVAAAAIVRANGAVLRECVVVPGDSTVEVTVEVRGSGVLANAPPARVRARAGPAAAFGQGSQGVQGSQGDQGSR